MWKTGEGRAEEHVFYWLLNWIRLCPNNHTGLSCVNLNSLGEKASSCDSTGWFVDLCWQVERRWACLRGCCTHHGHTEMKHQLHGGDLKWWANGCDTCSRTPSPFLSHQWFTHVGWVTSATLAGTSQSGVLFVQLCADSHYRHHHHVACRLSWHLNHSTCSAACYCPTNANKREGDLLQFVCQ